MSKAKEFGKLLEKVMTEAKKEAGSRQNMQRLGNAVTTDMVKRVQLGYGVNETGGKRQKFEPLTESTKLQRAGKLGFWTDKKGNKVPTKDKTYISQNKPKLSQNTSANRSNLTRTGLLMRNIGSLVTGFGKLTIGFRSSYGGRIAAYVSKKRPFFFLTDKETKRAESFVRKVMLDALERAKRKYFK